MNDWDGHSQGHDHSHGHGHSYSHRHSDSHGHGHSSGAEAEHGPSEERGRASWSAPEPGFPPPWASAQTQTSRSLPPWAPAPAAPPVSGTPAPAPAPAAPHGVRRLLVALTVTVVLGSAAGAGFWYVTRDHHQPGHPGGSSAVAGAAPASGGAAPAGSPAASAPTAGYRTARDPVGYTVEVPRGWTRRQQQGQKAPLVSYAAPGDGRRIQIFRVSEETPAASLDLAEHDPGYGFARQPGYRVLDRAHGDTWAELTYRYDGADQGARQVVDHRFTASDGTLYAIRVSGPESLPPGLLRKPLRAAVGSFCPVGAACP